LDIKDTPDTKEIAPVFTSEPVP